MSQDLIQRLIGQLGASNEFPMVLTDCNCNDVQHEAYQQAKKSFNRKFDFRPAAIIYVENSAQVSKIVKFANAHKESIALRVRSWWS
jgi:phage-related protein